MHSACKFRSELPMGNITERLHAGTLCTCTKTKAEKKRTWPTKLAVGCWGLWDKVVHWGPQDASAYSQMRWFPIWELSLPRVLLKPAREPRNPHEKHTTLYNESYCSPNGGAIEGVEGTSANGRLLEALIGYTWPPHNAFCLLPDGTLGATTVTGSEGSQVSMARLALLWA